ncbi:MAG TPA: hypothetical protein VKD72_36630 [Gemmataceae bacterium]|nr:hypothetical protein [Gemmataceae bacterium]
MDTLARSVLERLPLAEAVLWLWRWIAEDDYLQALFEAHRGRCYEKVIRFPLLVQLIADALLEHGGSANQSFERAIEDDQLPASIQAAYGKLRRLPVALSMAFLAGCTDRLRALFPAAARAPAPASLRRLRRIVYDGKALKRVAKRLKPLRGVPGGLPPLAAFTAEEGDHFLVRYHASVAFSPDPERPPRGGLDGAGRAYTEEWGWLGAPANQRRRYVRRIILPRPGAEAVVLVTDLLDAESYPGSDLLAVYLDRWGIERVFQKVTEVFGLQGLIGGTPQATIFQFAFCLVLYNLIQVVRGYVAEAQQRPAETISVEKLFADVTEELIAWNRVVEPATTVALFAEPLPRAALRARLRVLLAGVWTERWLKAPGKKPAPPAKKGKRTHGSVYRILEAHKRQQRSQKCQQ